MSVLKKHSVLRNGRWSLIDPLPAWDGNLTHDNFVAYAWNGGQDGPSCITVVNFAPTQGQCRLRLPSGGMAGRSVLLRDLMGPEIYRRDGSELLDPGLFIDHRPWQLNLFELQPA